VTLVSSLIPFAPPTTGAELVDRHWAVTSIPGARRQALLDAAQRGALDDPGEANTVATAFEYAALVGRDALRAGSTAPAATLEREALRVGAGRAMLLRAALGLGGRGAATEAVLRDAARLLALGAVSGAAPLAEARRVLETPPAAELLERAEEALGHPGDGDTQAAELWVLWRRLLALPAPDELANLVAQLARLRERHDAAGRAAPAPANDDELRARFRAEALQRLAEAAALLSLALRDRGEPEATCRALSAHCAAARAGLPGAPGIVVLATWLELGALATIRRRHASLP
jgi:hypothetical protein